MSYGKRILIYGDDHRAREMQGHLAQVGAQTEIVFGVEKTLSELERVMPDALVFVVQVYQENILDLVKKVHEIPGLEQMPILYMGDFIESKNQLYLQAIGVKTLTLGPVPAEEGARYILSLL